jgi:3-oxoacyl-[acyl-carrier-protein] synthase III
MKKLLLAAVAVFAIGFALAEPVHDWHEIEAVHVRIKEAIQEVQDIRVKNHYDMAGHGAKAEDFLKEAEKELALAVEAAKKAK